MLHRSLDRIRAGGAILTRTEKRVAGVQAVYQRAAVTGLVVAPLEVDHAPAQQCMHVRHRACVQS